MLRTSTPFKGAALFLAITALGAFSYGAGLKIAVRVKSAGTEAAGVSRKKYYVRLGGGYGVKSFSYDNSWSFDMYRESGQVSEKYSVKASGSAFDLGLGFMFTPTIGAELSFIPAWGKSKGTFSASFPHPYYSNYPRSKKWTSNGLKYSAYEINLNLIYRFPVPSGFGLYLMAGGTCFLGVKIESLKVIDWTETGYPYMNLKITPRYTTYSGNAFGFNGGGGLDYQLSDSAAINLNARFSSGSAKIKIEANEIKIPAGGIRATAGIKIGF